MKQIKTSGKEQRRNPVEVFSFMQVYSHSLLEIILKSTGGPTSGKEKENEKKDQIS